MRQYQYSRPDPLTVRLLPITPVRTVRSVSTTSAHRNPRQFPGKETDGLTEHQFVLEPCSR
jgi:hypothetical protein